MQPSDTVKQSTPSFTLKETKTPPPTASLAGRAIGEKTYSSEIAELRAHINKLSEILHDVIPYQQKTIEDLKNKQIDLEKQLSQISAQVNTHFSQILTSNSSLLGTVTTILDGTQRDFQRLAEQVEDNGKAQKEQQEQVKTILQLTLKSGLKEGLFKMDDDGVSIK